MSVKENYFDGFVYHFKKIKTDTLFFIWKKSCTLKFFIWMYVLEIEILKIVKVMDRPKIVK